MPNSTYINRSSLALRRIAMAAVAMASFAAAARSAHAADGPSPSAATANTVKLPDGPGSVAGMSGTAEVSQFSGQVSYSVPFDLPAGITGFGPGLSLSYSGDLGNGPVGIGWTTGAGAIVRSTRQGVPSYTDADVLELGGIAGAGGRLIRLTDGTYRVEAAGNAVRVQRTGRGFTVTDGAGVRYLVGLTAASRTQDDHGRIAVWNLERVVHPNGQQVRYEYTTHRGASYLSAIIWGPGERFRVQLAYEDRYDSHTSFRYGFEVTTARRLAHVTVRSMGQRLRRYYLSYDASLAVSRLRWVRATGYRGEGELPPLRFTYGGDEHPELKRLAGTGGWALNKRGVIFHDVDGDGADDLLRLEMGNHQWRRNLGGRFGPVRALTGASALALDSSRLMDLDGDSRAELVRTVDDTWRAYKLSGAQWSSIGELAGTRNLPLLGGAVLADINGDGRPDVIQAETSGIRINFANRSRQLSYTSPVRLPPIDSGNANVEPGARGVRFMDINGDGLTDVLWLADAWMKLYLGRGDGTFQSVGVRAYPWGGNLPESNRLTFADLNRDGLVDAVLITAGNLRWYRGLANGGFESDYTALPRPEESDYDAVISFADANANGSVDVVWSSPAGMWILDFTGATSKGMLTEIDNGLGKTTRYRYRASALLALDDDAAGNPWTYLVPASIAIPVEVIDDVGDGSAKRVAQYHVRDGFWDGHERRFGGFLFSRSTAPGPNPRETAITETEYDPGLGIDRVLRGAAKRVTQLRGDGFVYAVTETTTDTMAVQGLTPGANALENAAVYLRVPIVTEVHSLSFEGVDEPIKTVVRTRYDGEGRPVEIWTVGRTDLNGDGGIVRRRYAERDPKTWVGAGLVCDESLLESDGTLVSRTQTIYGDEFGPAPLCQPGKALAHSTRAWLAAEDRWVETSRVVRYSANWNPIETLAGDVRRTVRYDAADYRAVSETVYPSSGTSLTWSIEWDDARGLPMRAVGPDGISTSMQYDALGRPIAVSSGTAPAHIHYVYDWRGLRPATHTYVFDGPRSELGAFSGAWAAGSKWRETVSIADGAGQAVHSATRLGTNRWLVSGGLVRDHRGRVVQATEPYTWTGTDIRQATAPAGGAKQTMEYDGIDRIVTQTLPTGARKRIEYFAFGQRVFSDELAPITSYTDGQGRIIRTERPLDDGTTQSVDADYDAAGRLLAMHLQDGEVSHRFQYDSLGRMTYAVDPDIGERFLVYDDAGRLLTSENAAQQETRYSYDGVGRLTSVLGSDGVTYTYHYDTARDSAFGNAAARLAWVEEPSGIVELGYDSYGRQTRFRRTIHDTDRGVDLVADERSTLSTSGQATSIDYGDDVVVDFSYDAAGRLVRVGDYWSIDSFDGAGRVVSETFGNGIQQRYQRDVLGQPIQVTIGKPSTPPLYDVMVMYNSYGAPFYVSDFDSHGLDHSASFGYDRAGRLTDAEAAHGAYRFSYKYDALQNMTERLATGPTKLDMFSGQYIYGGPKPAGTAAGNAGPRQLTSILPAPDPYSAAPPTGTNPAPLATFEYDAAGRQIRNGDRRMFYNGFDQLVRVENLTDPDVSVVDGSIEHSYGYDGFRVSTRSLNGDVQYWFTPNTSETNGVREHLIHVGSKLVARVTVGRIDDTTLSSSTSSAAGAVSAKRWLAGFVALLALVLLIITLSRTRRGRQYGPRLVPLWQRLAASAALFTMVTSTLSGCGSLFGHERQAAWRRLEVRYYHTGFSAGPVLITRADGTVFDERRYEPFGTAIDAYSEQEGIPDVGAIGPVNFRRDPQNILNKKTDPNTGWSYHGARWLAPQTTQWLTPDPPVKAPDPKFMSKPWGLHPYQYVEQNPNLFWDPDGRESMSVAMANRLGLRTDDAVYNHIGVKQLRDSRFITARGWRKSSGTVFWITYDKEEKTVLYHAHPEDLANYWPQRRQFRWEAQAKLDTQDKVDVYLAITGRVENPLDAVSLLSGVQRRQMTPSKIAFGMFGALVSAAALPAKPQASCFVAGTPVATAAGSIAIDEIHVGERVLTDGKTKDTIEHVGWRRIRLTMRNPQRFYDVIDVDLLRAPEWIEKMGVAEGRTILLQIPELLALGPAHVISVSDAVDVGPGEGRVVTATFSHFSSDLYEIRFFGDEKPLQVTGRHPLFSVDRGRFVLVEELLARELLRTLNGVVRIANIVKLPGAHRVYNLEVQSDHVYFAGETEILAHNSCFQLPPVVRAAGGIKGEFTPKGYSYRIDTNAVANGEGGFHIHVFRNGGEIAKVSGFGSFAVRHRGRVLSPPSQLNKQVRRQVNSLVRYVQQKLKNPGPR